MDLFKKVQKLWVKSLNHLRDPDVMGIFMLKNKS